MRYGYRGYWTEICPVYDESRGRVMYWRYEIFSFANNEFIFEGHDGDRSSALATAQAHIEILVRDEAVLKLRAA